MAMETMRFVLDAVQVFREDIKEMVQKQSCLCVQSLHRMLALTDVALFQSLTSEWQQPTRKFEMRGFASQFDENGSDARLSGPGIRGGAQVNSSRGRGKCRRKPLVDRNGVYDSCSLGSLAGASRGDVVLSAPSHPKDVDHVRIMQQQYTKQECHLKEEQRVLSCAGEENPAGRTAKVVQHVPALVLTRSRTKMLGSAGGNSTIASEGPPPKKARRRGGNPTAVSSAAASAVEEEKCENASNVSTPGCLDKDSLCELPEKREHLSARADAKAKGGPRAWSASSTQSTRATEHLTPVLHVESAADREIIQEMIAPTTKDEPTERRISKPILNQMNAEPAAIAQVPMQAQVLPEVKEESSKTLDRPRRTRSIIEIRMDPELGQNQAKSLVAKDHCRNSGENVSIAHTNAEMRCQLSSVVETAVGPMHSKVSEKRGEILVDEGENDLVRKDKATCLVSKDKGEQMDSISRSLPRERQENAREIFRWKAEARGSSGRLRTVTSPCVGEGFVEKKVQTLEDATGAEVQTLEDATGAEVQTLEDATGAEVQTLEDATGAEVQALRRSAQKWAGKKSVDARQRTALVDNNLSEERETDAEMIGAVNVVEHSEAVKHGVRKDILDTRQRTSLELVRICLRASENTDDVVDGPCPECVDPGTRHIRKDIKDDELVMPLAWGGKFLGKNRETALHTSGDEFATLSSLAVKQVRNERSETPLVISLESSGSPVEKLENRCLSTVAVAARCEEQHSLALKRLRSDLVDLQQGITVELDKSSSETTQKMTILMNATTPDSGEVLSSRVEQGRRDIEEERPKILNLFEDKSLEGTLCRTADSDVARILQKGRPGSKGSDPEMLLGPITSHQTLNEELAVDEIGVPVGLHLESDERNLSTVKSAVGHLNERRLLTTLENQETFCDKPDQVQGQGEKGQLTGSQSFEVSNLVGEHGNETGGLENRTWDISHYNSNHYAPGGDSLIRASENKEEILPQLRCSHRIEADEGTSRLAHIPCSRLTFYSGLSASQMLARIVDGSKSNASPPRQEGGILREVNPSLFHGRARSQGVSVCDVSSATSEAPSATHGSSQAIQFDVHPESLSPLKADGNGEAPFFTAGAMCFQHASPLGNWKESDESRSSFSGRENFIHGALSSAKGASQANHRLDMVKADVSSASPHLERRAAGATYATGDDTQARKASEIGSATEWRPHQVNPKTSVATKDFNTGNAFWIPAESNHFQGVVSAFRSPQIVRDCLRVVNNVCRISELEGCKRTDKTPLKEDLNLIKPVCVSKEERVPADCCGASNSKSRVDALNTLFTQGRRNDFFQHGVCSKFGNAQGYSSNLIAAKTFVPVIQRPPPSYLPTRKREVKVKALVAAEALRCKQVNMSKKERPNRMIKMLEENVGFALEAVEASAVPREPIEAISRSADRSPTIKKSLNSECSNSKRLLGPVEKLKRTNASKLRAEKKIKLFEEVRRRKEEELKRKEAKYLAWRQNKELLEREKKRQRQENTNMLKQRRAEESQSRTGQSRFGTEDRKEQRHDEDSDETHRVKAAEEETRTLYGVKQREGASTRRAEFEANFCVMSRAGSQGGCTSRLLVEQKRGEEILRISNCRGRGQQFQDSSAKSPVPCRLSSLKPGRVPILPAEREANIIAGVPALTDSSRVQRPSSASNRLQSGNSKLLAPCDPARAVDILSHLQGGSMDAKRNRSSGVSCFETPKKIPVGGDKGPASYDMTPYRGSDDEEDDTRPKKLIPEWARKEKLMPQLLNQLSLDPDNIFAGSKTCSLKEVFGTTGSKKVQDFGKRSDSGDWVKDRVSWKEELMYKVAMGYMPTNKY